MIRSSLFFSSVLSFFAMSSAYAGFPTKGYGDTVEAAQDNALKHALQAAETQGTCIGALDKCEKQNDGLYACQAWVADHPGSCNKESSDWKKLKEVWREVQKSGVMFGGHGN